MWAGGTPEKRKCPHSTDLVLGSIKCLPSLPFSLPHSPPNQPQHNAAKPRSNMATSTRYEGVPPLARRPRTPDPTTPTHALYTHTPTTAAAATPPVSASWSKSHHSTRMNPRDPPSSGVEGEEEEQEKRRRTTQTCMRARPRCPSVDLFPCPPPWLARPPMPGGPTPS